MKPNPGLIPRFNLAYDFNDFVYSIKSIFTGNDFDFNQLKSIFGKECFFFTNTGRSSLYIILRALNLPLRSKIGVPLYSCTVVFDAIIKAGHIPYFIDISLDNYTLDPCDLKNKIEDLSAVVVIHTFGRPADMDEIKKIAGDIPVIEDCAHSLLSEYKGKRTGTMGVASFFSLNKYISSGKGGMIILNDEDFKENFQREINLLNSPSNIDEINHSFFTYIYSSLYHKPWYGLFAFPLGSKVKYKISNNKKDFKTAKIRRSVVGVFLKKMDNFREKVKLQRKNSQILIEKLQNALIILPYEKKDTWCNYYLFSILFKNKKNRDAAYEYLRKRGVDTAKLFHKTPLIAKEIYGYTGGCFNAERCADTLLTIPNHHTLTQNELLKVAESVKEVI